MPEFDGNPELNGNPKAIGGDLNLPGDGHLQTQDPSTLFAGELLGLKQQAGDSLPETATTLSGVDALRLEAYGFDGLTNILSADNNDGLSDPDFSSFSITPDGINFGPSLFGSNADDGGDGEEADAGEADSIQDYFLDQTLFAKAATYNAGESDIIGGADVYAGADLTQSDVLQTITEAVFAEVTAVPADIADGSTVNTNALDNLGAKLSDLSTDSHISADTQSVIAAEAAGILNQSNMLQANQLMVAQALFPQRGSGNDAAIARTNNDSTIVEQEPIQQA